SVEVEVLGLLKQSVRPEFLSRIDETIIFRPISRKQVREIVKLQVQNVEKMAAKNNIYISTTDEVIDYIADIGFDPQFGARPIKRVIQKRVMNELSKQVLSGKVKAGDHVVMDVFDDLVVFRKPLEKEIEEVIKN